MSSTALSPLVFFTLFWLVMLPVFAFLLRTACGICQANLPTYRRALVIVLLVGPAAYFTFDLCSYGLMLALQDVGYRAPPGYTYAHWLREPLGLKWQVNGTVPGLRYLPIVFALCLAGVLQVFLLEVTFRIGLLIFLLQWAFSFVALAAASFLLTLTQGFLGQILKPGTVPVAWTRPAGPHLPDVPEELVEGPALEAARHGLEQAQHTLAPYLDSINRECEPAARHLPAPVREFLESGGWLLVCAVLGLVVLLWLRSLGKRLYRALFRRKKRKRYGEKQLRENLALLSEGYTEAGPRQVTVKGIPARLRLVVMAPAGKDVGDLSPEMVDHLLDLIKPGLGEVASYDYPKVHVWPRQYSAGGFPLAFFEHVRVPESKGRRSPWVLLAGTVSLGRQKVHVGLALHADEPNNLRNVTVKNEQWLDHLGLKGEKAARVRV